MINLPYGKADFKDIRNRGMVYIDKTMFIEKIENDRDYLMYLRPRRFGKSLLTSMLGYYYDIRYRDEFDEYKRY